MAHPVWHHHCSLIYKSGEIFLVNAMCYVIQRYLIGNMNLLSYETLNGVYHFDPTSINNNNYEMAKW